jgi:hypothetical protein
MINIKLIEIINVDLQILDNLLDLKFFTGQNISGIFGCLIFF